MAGAVNSTETDGEPLTGDAPPSVDLASVRSSLSGADSDDQSRSLRAIASAFDEAHASTSAARFRAECALCALLDDPRRPLDGPRRLAALFVLARGGEALGADDGSIRGGFGENDKNKNVDASPFAATLRDWASGPTTTNSESDLSSAERLFLRRLADPATRRAVGDAAPRAWARENSSSFDRDAENGASASPFWDDDAEARVTDAHLGSTMRVFTTVPTKKPPEMPFLARAFDAERAWFEDDEDDGYDGGYDGAKLPLWDETAGVPRADASFASYSATRAILEAAAEVPVAPMRQAAAAAALRRNPALAGAVAARADAFLKTTDRNPPVAAAVLLATARVPSARAARLPALLGVLLENVGVHAMEVVAKAFEESREERLKAQTEASESGAAEGGASKDDQNASRLSAEPLLPATFLTPFMAKCVRRCVDHGEGGGGSRAKRASAARLTCMFLQVLLRERHAAAADLPAEVESFCVEFMSVKEAADLFRLVKSLQREDARVANGEDAERGHHLLRGE